MLRQLARNLLADDTCFYYAFSHIDIYELSLDTLRRGVCFNQQIKS